MHTYIPLAYSLYSLYPSWIGIRLSEWVEQEILQSASRSIGAAPIGSVTWCLKIRHPKISGIELKWSTDTLYG